MDYQMGILKTELNCRFLNKWLYDKKNLFLVHYRHFTTELDSENCRKYLGDGQIHSCIPRYVASLKREPEECKI